MKNIISVFVLLSVFACKTNDTEQGEVIEQTPKTCVAADFFELKNEALQTDFFVQLDAAHKAENPEGGVESDVWQDVTREALQAFLSDATKAGFAENKVFEKDYNFNLAPSDYKDSESCMDKLSVNFDENTCTFNLTILNSFPIDENECAESMVSLNFKIINNKIVDFKRDIAG